MLILVTVKLQGEVRYGTNLSLSRGLRDVQHYSVLSSVFGLNTDITKGIIQMFLS